MTKFKAYPTTKGTLKSPGQSQISTKVDNGSRELLVSSGGLHNPFVSQSSKLEGGLYNGTTKSDKIRYSGWPIIWRAENWMHEIPDVPLPSFAMLSTKLYGASDPSKPYVDIANFIGELRDFPDMIKSIGDRFLSKGNFHSIGHLNLSYQFGWKPFFDDVVKMFSFAEMCQKRFKELKSLKENGSTIRKRRLFEESRTITSTEVLGDSYAGNVSCLCSFTVKEVVWGYVIWRTTQDFPQTDADIAEAAVNSALGLYIRPSTVWNLLPWTWAIDWFANIGDVLDATNNVLSLEVDTACICKSHDGYGTCIPIGSTSEGIQVSNYTRHDVYHERGYADPPTLTAQLPVLDLNQLGILGSIGATRRRFGRL